MGVSTSSPLSYSYVRAFMVGRALSVLAAQIVSTTAGWQLFKRTGDPLALGMIGLVELLPVLVLIIPSGMMADRFPRRDIGIIAHISLALTALSLSFISWLDGPNWAIYSLLATIGMARAFAAPSVGTIIPQLLPVAEFNQANAWLSSTNKLATVSGPAFAGFCIDWFGPDISYAIATGGHIGFCLLLWAFVPRVKPKVKLTRATVSFADGFTFIRRNRMFLGAITLDLFAVMLGGAVMILPAFTEQILQAGPTALGWLRAAPGLGAFMMAIIIARIPPWRRPGRTMLWSVAGFGVATVGLGLSQNVVMAFVCLFFTGVFDEIGVLVRQTLEQTITPDRLRGRVSSFNHIFVSFSNQFGGFYSGSMAAWLGVSTSITIGGFASIVVVLFALRLFPEFVRLGPLTELSPDEDSVPERGATKEA